MRISCMNGYLHVRFNNTLPLISGGVTKAPIAKFSITKNWGDAENKGYISNITFIFVATHIRHERDI